MVQLFESEDDLNRGKGPKFSSLPEAMQADARAQINRRCTAPYPLMRVNTAVYRKRLHSGWERWS